jgi:hypothetical protein
MRDYMNSFYTQAELGRELKVPMPRLVKILKAQQITPDIILGKSFGYNKDVIERIRPLL